MGSLKIPPIRFIRKAGYMENIYIRMSTNLSNPDPPNCPITRNVNLIRLNVSSFVNKNTHLEVYDHTEDEDGGHEVHEVGQVLPVEGLPQSPDLVLPGGEQMEQSNQSTLKLSS